MLSRVIHLPGSPPNPDGPPWPARSAAAPQTCTSRRRSPKFVGVHRVVSATAARSASYRALIADTIPTQWCRAACS
ncbi:MAG: hypothetical protein TE42_02555 [Candidatus Synechococcus spongiarum SP3]|uniref:Uncharacterized protein n=1 Tax=Candidatus Synechococcus spongiarum SP3 TaxID=1604020 RepID=A0A0G2IWS7_9SYNE|nr:MAG: hypothetical protein TE42_02555 [Candidatus Synechococcus spongiarum SP3]